MVLVCLNVYEISTKVRVRKKGEREREGGVKKTVVR